MIIVMHPDNTSVDVELTGRWFIEDGMLFCEYTDLSEHRYTTKKWASEFDIIEVLGSRKTKQYREIQGCWTQLTPTSMFESKNTLWMEYDFIHFS